LPKAHDDARPVLPPATPLSWRDLVFALTGIDLLVCPVCGERAMERRPLDTRAIRCPTPDTS
jgi:hypothetical protein